MALGERDKAQEISILGRAAVHLEDELKTSQLTPTGRRSLLNVLHDCYDSLCTEKKQKLRENLREWYNKIIYLFYLGLQLPVSLSTV